MKHRRTAKAVLFVLTAVVQFLALTGCKSDDYVLCNVMFGGWCEPPKSAAALPGQALYVNATAHVAGALGTNWRSDVEIHNLGDETSTCRIWLLEHGGDNSEPDHRELSLEPGKSERLGDVLASEFGEEGQAALILMSDSGRILVTSRTYNLLGEGNELGLPAGSTFGQYIPAQPLGEAIRFGEQGRLIQLAQSVAADRGFRTNLGLVNTTDAELTVEVALFTASGEPLGSLPAVLPPQGYRQLNRVFANVTAGEVDDGYAVVRTTTSQGRFFAYASVVDNLTGDPVAISAVRLPEEAPPAAERPIFVVASAHAAGAAGTNWRTDLEVHCWSDEGADYTIELLEHGADNSTPVSQSYALGAGESVRFTDVLDSEFGFEGAAALRIAASSGRILVTSRTYNLLGEGNPFGLPAGATFGQFIPGVDARKAIGFAEEGRLIQLAHTQGSASGYRTNLVLVNATTSGIDVEIELYRADGTLLGIVARSLAPYEYRQLNRVFETVTGEDVGDGYVIVRATTEGGTFFALASVVDNLTGDPVGMGAPVILSPAGEEFLGEIEGMSEVLGRGSLEELVSRVQSTGIGSLFDEFLAAYPDVATGTTGGMVIDYGDGYAAPDGTTRSGSTTVDTSGLTVGSGGITGIVTVVHDQLLIDGEPPLAGSTAWTFDLAKRADGTVAGDISVSPAGGTKSSGSLSGTIGIDTAICVEYPISGCLTLTVEDEVITIILEPHCDGSFSRDVTGSSCGGSSETATFILPGGVPLEMVPIPAGTFMMGAYDGEVSADESEYPQHRVTLSRHFWMGKYEVTQAQWQAVMGSNPASDAGVGDSYPVYNVSWNDIAGPGGFIERLNQHLGTTTFRLPTEAEWEYAARAGTTTRFSYGDALDEPCDEECNFCELHDQYMLWCGNNELVNPDNPNSTEPVGWRTPNAFGLYDTHGNIAEWVNDWYVPYSAGAQTDPTGPETGSFRMWRNGGWGSDAASCRSADRYAYSPDFRGRIIGFRLARSESP